MFSNGGGDDEYLYDFNTNLDMQGGYGTIGTAGGNGFGRGPMTSYRAPGTSSQRPPMSSMGRGVAPMTAMNRTGNLPSRMGTAGGGVVDARPMTSVTGSGYQSSRDNRPFDPFNLGRGPAPPLAEKKENSPEDMAKDMEKKVHRLIEASAEAVVNGELSKALEKAKEAGKAERNLCKYKETHNLVDQINLDLTYAIIFNLANVYHQNKMYDEAINTYQLILKNKNYPQSGRLKVNMGNIYYEQRKYTQAIKMYRMALDQIPTTGKELRFRILRNIGNAFVKLGQFQDAMESYDLVMTGGSPDIISAFNLLLCLYARGDKDKLRKHFTKMLTISIPGMTEEDEEKTDDLDEIIADRPDALKAELRRRKELHDDLVLKSARLIAPLADDKDDHNAGYKWIVDQLRHEYEAVSSKVELDLAMSYMKKRKFEEAIEVLKAFEKKDSELRAMAGTNLSFIYFLENDLVQAEKHANLAIEADRYNAQALVNKGNCLYMAGEYNRAKELFLEAIGVEADCVEGIFNLGLTNLKLNAISEARQAFDKLHTILPSAPEALFQIGSIYEKSQDLENAAKTYEMLLNQVPGDPNICSKLGQIYEKLDDENTANHWQMESHRHFPVNLAVISWLGVWYVKREMYEQAIEFFEKAGKVQPGEVKWRLMVTSCYRRLGDYYKALDLYTEIHEEHPENIEALQYLEALCKDLSRPHEEYSRRLEKLRRNMPAQTQSGATARPQASTRGGPTSNGPVGGPPPRSERPRPERVVEEIDDVPSSPRAPMAAPRASTRAGGRPKGRSNEDEDEFGDTDVGSM